MQKYEVIKDIPIISYLIVLGLGIWGAILNYVKREEDDIDRTTMQKIGIFLLDLISSMGLSVVTFLGAVGVGANELIAVAIAGFVAHQGTRAIYLIELVIAEKLGSKLLKDEIQKEKDGIQ